MNLFCSPLRRSGLIAVLFYGTAFSAMVESVGLAASPTINSITPAGGRRGTEVTVKITGSNLTDLPDVFFYDKGIKVKNVEPYKDKNGKVENDRSISAVLEISPNCTLGFHAFRVRTGSGIAEAPLLFSVGALEETPEEESNDTFEKAQAIKLDRTVTGFILGEDVDWYVVEAKKGERVTVEVEGIRLARGYYDPYLAIFDANRKEVARADDSVFSWHDPIVGMIVPADGKYYLMLRETTYGGSNGAAYRMHVGRFPRPVTAIPAGGRPGETLEVTLLGDIAGPPKQKVTIPKKPEFLSTIFAPDDKATRLFAQDDRGTSPTPIVFRVNDLANVLEVEPNDEITQATKTSAPIAMNGVIEKPGDVDCFRFVGKKGQVFDIRVHGRSIRSPLDSVLSVYRMSKGATVGTNDDSGSADSYFRLTCPDDDNYAVQVKDMLGRGGETYAYRIEVTPVQPTVRLSVAEKARYVDTTASVPRGSHAAVMINATRKDFGGDVILDVANFPKGMTYETVPLTSGQTTVPLLLSATDDAPLADGILDIRGRAADDKFKINSRLLQTTVYFRINQRPLYEEQIYALSGAVIDKAPFKLEIVQPKVPLVRNGQLDLKIHATREAGFTAPISVRMLYTPAGVGANTTAQIPEGKDEVVLQLTASNSAELRDWQIVALGTATVGNGDIEVASPFAKLTVGQPFFEFAFKPGSVEQGGELKYVVETSNIIEFAGKAKVQLLGLPAEATSEPIEITKDADQAVFTVKTTKGTPTGRHKSIVCKLVVMQKGEPISQTLGPGEIRVDATLPTRPSKSKLSGPQASAADIK